MYDDFIAFKNYFSEAANKVPAESFERQTMEHKFKHSVEVLETGKIILQQTPELKNKSKTFINLAEKALLFHDVGRFEEAVQQYHNHNSYPTADHGLIGYEILKKNPHYNNPCILFALRLHGKVLEDIISSQDWQEIKNSPDCEDIKQILFLVRDADKLANLKHIKTENRLQTDIVFQQLSVKPLNTPLSADVLEQFYARRTILSSSLQSFADRILQVVSWIYDINYTTSKEIFKTQKYALYLIGMLSQHHPYAGDIEKIREMVQQNGY